jgi:hypothetical protein
LSSFAVILLGNCRAPSQKPERARWAHPFDGNSILRAELVHQAIELFVRLEIRVVFSDDQRAAKRGRLLIGGAYRFLG